MTMHEIEYSPPLILYYTPGISIGWVGVGWRRRSKTRHLLRELHYQGTVFVLFRRSPRLAVELDPFCVGRTFTPHKGGDCIT